MTEKTTFLPFHAINEFMRPDFRLAVIRDVLTNQSQLPDELSSDLNNKIKKYVTIPGFRSSEKAPPLIKVLPTSKAFEKHPELVGVVINGWVFIHNRLRDNVYEVLKTRNWNIIEDINVISLETISSDLIKSWPVFPIDFDRTKSPGFYPYWPKGEDFETLYGQFTQLFPESDASIDKVSLMTVWLSLRLPYHVGEDEETNHDTDHLDI